MKNAVQKQDFVYKLYEDVMILDAHCKDCPESDVMLSDKGRVLLSYTTDMLMFLINNRRMITENPGYFLNGNSKMIELFEFYDRSK